MNLVEIVRAVVPRRLRYGMQRFVSVSEIKLRHRERMNPLSNVWSSDENTSGSPVVLGIVHNAAQYHRHFVQAALEMGIPFRVLDLQRSDWLEQVRASGCGALLVWPNATRRSLGSMIKDRVRVLEEEMRYPMMPGSAELWMYEDKRRMAYWLAAHRIPHPRTCVFYDRCEAEAFARMCDLPVVFKTSFGAAAAGVEIVRSRGRLTRLVRRAFSRGIAAAGAHHRDRQWGSILFQEFVPIVREWRMVRIGNSYFGHPKGQVGDFHSGSGVALWDVPDTRLLNLLHNVTESGGFRSMNLDIFETRDGRLLVNEMQAVFGASTSVDQLRVNGVPGRFTRGDSTWQFEAGDFARNACANERIRDLLARVAHLHLPVPGLAGAPPPSTVSSLS